MNNNFLATVQEQQLYKNKIMQQRNLLSLHRRWVLLNDESINKEWFSFNDRDFYLKIDFLLFKRNNNGYYFTQINESFENSQEYIQTIKEWITLVDEGFKKVYACDFPNHIGLKYMNDYKYYFYINKDNNNIKEEFKSVFAFFYKKEDNNFIISITSIRGYNYKGRQENKLLYEYCYNYKESYGINSIFYFNCYKDPIFLYTKSLKTTEGKDQIDWRNIKDYNFQQPTEANGYWPCYFNGYLQNNCIYLVKENCYSPVIIDKKEKSAILENKEENLKINIFDNIYTNNILAENNLFIRYY